jgi:hypothetical protein
MTLEILTSDALAPIRHGFFTRRGGVSSGIFTGLNCGLGSSDQRDVVHMNRSLVAEAMGVTQASLMSVHQVHSSDVVVVDNPSDATPPQADAIVTATPDIALSILTADCAPILFADAITQGKPIQVFNQGRHQRDFTYIDDIVGGVIGCLDRIPAGNAQWSGLDPDPASSNAPWQIYNIGRGEPIELLHYIELMEQVLGKTTSKELLPAQPGDVEATYADIDTLVADTGYTPKISIQQGLQQFAGWYIDYYAKK